MSEATAPSGATSPVAPVGLNGRLPLSMIAAAVLWLCAFSGFFVLSEPAPYDLLIIVSAGLAFLCGLPLPRAIAPMIGLLLAYMSGGILASTQVPTFDRAPMYMAVTGYLIVSSIFYASVVAHSAQLLRVIVYGYVAGAICAALAGIVGYFGLVPGSDVFLLYGRAKATFQDPNVFGPFLIFPATWLTYMILTQPLRRGIFAAGLLLILVAGLFLSFSRAAWGMIVFAMCSTGFVLFLSSRNPIMRLRIVGLAIAGFLVIALGLMAALHTDAVGKLFAERAELVQSYDASHLGRFARHALGFMLAGERPLGIGPLQFYKTFTEDPHNMYLKSFMAYGWIGGVTWIVLMAWTLARLFPLIFQPRPTRGIAIALFVTLVGHAMVALVIDMDHWRHNFLLIGLAWGLFAQEATLKRDRAKAARRLS
ncbi:O-antigen ligase family protein [Breoghania sp.]|uniref:O-antigen ligase family protein n=1 Tax=Breoghania sp. TaxID=2065378 RepID=UPI002AA7B621|nr:O-antigen ligase family protein [Breoghania sp.]